MKLKERFENKNTQVHPELHRPAIMLADGMVTGKNGNRFRNQFEADNFYVAIRIYTELGDAWFPCAGSV
ncbi:MAG: hypothetical protein ACLU4J_11095 [Butyricimonas paravirosa]